MNSSQAAGAAKPRHTAKVSQREQSAPTGGSIVTIQRRTYFLAGQAIAIQVSGDPDAGNNGLFYLHSDHLGSANALSYGWQTDGTPHPSQGQRVGELTRFYPFGDYRTGGQSQITDLGFTGHKENRGLGLTYMNVVIYGEAR